MSIHISQALRKFIFREAPNFVLIGLCAHYLVYPVSAAAQEQTSITVSQFGFVELDGRLGHLGLTPINGEPSEGPGFLRAEILGEFQSPAFSILDEAGAAIAPLELSETLSDGFSRVFLGPATVPAQSFRLAFQAQTPEGAPIAIQLPRLYEPTSVAVKFSEAASGGPPGPRSLTATIINAGPAASFNLSASDELGTDIALSPTTLSLDQNASGEVLLEFVVPRMEEGYGRYVLTLTAVGSEPAPGANGNYGRIEVFSDTSPLIFDSGFEGAQP